MKKAFLLTVLTALSFTVMGQRIPTIGSPVVFESTAAYWLTSSKLDDTHIIATYKRDASNASASAVDIYGIVGEINTTTGVITWGTASILISDSNAKPFSIGLSADKAIIAYEFDTGSDIGRAHIVNISGSSITSIESAVNFSAGDFSVINGLRLASDKFVLAYDDMEDGNKGTAIIGTVSGSTLSFGSSEVFHAASTGKPSVQLLEENKIVIGYEDEATSGDPAEVVVGTITGTSLSFGASTEVHSSADVGAEVPVVALNSTTIVVAYGDDTASPVKGKLKVGTISGTDVSFGGSAIEFEAASDFNGTKKINDIFLQHTTGDEFLVVYSTQNSGDNAFVKVGLRSGNSVTFGSRNQYSDQTDDGHFVQWSTDLFSLVFLDETNSPKDELKYASLSLPSSAPSTATVAVTAFLEGAWNGSDMNTHLENANLVAASDPYGGINSHTATASVADAASVPDGVVDWVLVELREAGSAAAANDAARVGSAAGFLMSNGSIVATDGISNLTISLSGNSGSDFYVVVYHRNHLAIMSLNEISESSGVYTVDLSASGNVYESVNAVSTLSGSSKVGMHAGDIDQDGSIDADDLTTWRSNNGGSYVYAGSGKSDFNLDGVINAVDRNDFHRKNTSKTRQVPSS